MKKGTTFREWLAVVSIARELPFRLEELTRPYKVGDVVTPDNLDELSIGGLLTLSDMQDGVEMFFTVCREVLGMDEAKTANSEAVEVVRFVGWVVSQVQKINRLFGKQTTNPDAREMKAGISELKFGMFGLLDWYACRMGIADHHEVEKVSWLIIYKCLEMDTKRQKYNKRLQEVIADEYRRKH